MLEITPTGQACGAVVRGVDFCADVSTDTLKTIRSAWLEHHVLIFPNQTLDNDRLVRFAEYFGPIGDDPYFAPIEGHDRIAAVRREADETAPLICRSMAFRLELHEHAARSDLSLRLGHSANRRRYVVRQRT